MRLAVTACCWYPWQHGFHRPAAGEVLFAGQKSTQKRLAPGARRLGSCLDGTLRVSADAGRRQLAHPCAQTWAPFPCACLRCSPCFTAQCRSRPRIHALHVAIACHNSRDGFAAR